MTIKLSGVGGGIIKQYTLDPTKPVTDKTKVKSKNLWILYTPGSGGGGSGGTTEGMPIGLLMALTYATTTGSSGGGGSTPPKYELSVNTTGGIKRVEIP